MKKLLIAAALLIAGTGVFAQAQPKKDAKDAKMTVVKKEEPKKAEAKVVPVTKSTAAPAGPTKKDGTADMRFKANKEAAKTDKPAGPTKKDGTADMRFKANKEAAKKKG